MFLQIIHEEYRSPQVHQRSSKNSLCKSTISPTEKHCEFAPIDRSSMVDPLLPDPTINTIVFFLYFLFIFKLGNYYKDNKYCSKHFICFAIAVFFSIFVLNPIFFLSFCCMLSFIVFPGCRCVSVVTAQPR